MITARATVFLLLACLLPGCVGYIRLSDGRMWPRDPRFVLQKRAVSERPSTLDCHAVYVSEYAGGEFFDILRFWPDGKVMLRQVDHAPDLADAESFQNAYIGYYFEDGTNVFTELFLPAGSPAGKGGYSLTKRLIVGDALVSLSSSFDGMKKRDLREHRITFQKTPMQGMKLEPDW